MLWRGWPVRSWQEHAHEGGCQWEHCGDAQAHQVCSSRWPSALCVTNAYRDTLLSVGVTLDWALFAVLLSLASDPECVTLEGMCEPFREAADSHIGTPIGRSTSCQSQVLLQFCQQLGDAVPNRKVVVLRVICWGADQSSSSSFSTSTLLMRSSASRAWTGSRGSIASPFLSVLRLMGHVSEFKPVAVEGHVSELFVLRLTGHVSERGS